MPAARKSSKKQTSSRTTRSAKKPSKNKQPTPAQKAAARYVTEIGKIRETFNQDGKDMTILFADLRNSTAFKQQVDSLDGMVKTTAHNQLITLAVKERRGEVVKYMGDGVMAKFSGADAEHRAITCGLRAIELVEDANKANRWVDKDDYAMRTKVGIYSGPVWEYRFPEATVLDPQGSTVDIAARLCAMSRPQQVVCSEKTFKAAGGTAKFQNASMATLRFIAGVSDPLEVRALGEGLSESQRAPYRSHERSISKEVAALLDEAMRHYVTAEPLLEEDWKSVRLFERVLKKDPGCYDANMCIAQLYMLIANGKPDSADLYKKAIEHLCRAKQVRDKTCQPWLLQSWARYKLFEKSDRKEFEQLRHARALVETAIGYASDYHDKHGENRALTFKATYLWEFARAESSKTKKEPLLAEAADICDQIDRSWERHTNDCRADFLVTSAYVRMERGEAPGDDIEAMIKQALELEPTNLRALEAQKAIARRAGRGEGPFRRPTY